MAALKRTGKNPDISIVIPLYNEEDSLRELYQDIKKVLVSMKKNFEIIFVDDGSTDHSADVIRQLSNQDPRVKFLQFRRNYGKAAGLSAGFKMVRGEYIVTMDADLQDDPREIPNLLKKMEEGYDLVSGWKKVRRDRWSKRHASKVYNFFTSILSGIRLHDFNCGLKAYRREVIKNIHIYGELHRYLPVIVHHSGFRVTEIPVVHHPRRHGKSKYGIARFSRGAFDLMTILFLSRYQKRPLHLFGGLGLVSFLMGFAISFVLAYEKIFLGQHLSRRPILFLGVLLIIVGIQFVSIGLLGEMITAFRHDQEVYDIKSFLGFTNSEKPL
jgi:glycosyltransferase involved in cell wall biosynthesis